MARGIRTGRAWREARARVFATADTCWLCGQAVDMRRPYRNPDTGRVDPLSKSVDHVTPLSIDSSQNNLLNLAGLRLAHYGCNSSRGAAAPPTQHTPSRDW